MDKQTQIVLMRREDYNDNMKYVHENCANKTKI